MVGSWWINFGAGSIGAPARYSNFADACSSVADSASQAISYSSTNEVYDIERGDIVSWAGASRPRSYGNGDDGERKYLQDLGNSAYENGLVTDNDLIVAVDSKGVWGFGRDYRVNVGDTHIHVARVYGGSAVAPWVATQMTWHELGHVLMGVEEQVKNNHETGGIDTYEDSSGDLFYDDIQAMATSYTWDIGGNNCDTNITDLSVVCGTGNVPNQFECGTEANYCAYFSGDYESFHSPSYSGCTLDTIETSYKNQEGI